MHIVRKEVGVILNPPAPANRHLLPIQQAAVRSNYTFYPEVAQTSMQGTLFAAKVFLKNHGQSYDNPHYIIQFLRV